MKFNLNIEKKSFIGKDGNAVDYFEYSFDLNGSKIRLKPSDEDKKLASYLLVEIFAKGGNKA